MENEANAMSSASLVDHCRWPTSPPPPPPPPHYSLFKAKHLCLTMLYITSWLTLCLSNCGRYSCSRSTHASTFTCPSSRAHSSIVKSAVYIVKKVPRLLDAMQPLITLLAGTCDLSLAHWDGLATEVFADRQAKAQRLADGVRLIPGGPAVAALFANPIFSVSGFRLSIQRHNYSLK